MVQEFDHLTLNVCQANDGSGQAGKKWLEFVLAHKDCV